MTDRTNIGADGSAFLHPEPLRPGKIAEEWTLSGGRIRNNRLWLISGAVLRSVTA
ncbi:hypothetical protein ACFXG4_44650 [Nocardia sp. NPDC059246]|uniref:hypothetical protein n=1 Tax=unclassified Nocardia TaxID=2637762 RepID=UPI0036837864